MNAQATRLLTELIIIPAIKKLADKRGLTLSTKQIKAIADNPEPILRKMKQSKSLQTTVIDEAVDLLDLMLGSTSDVIVKLIKRVNDES